MITQILFICLGISLIINFCLVCFKIKQVLQNTKIQKQNEAAEQQYNELSLDINKLVQQKNNLLQEFQDQIKKIDESRITHQKQVDEDFQKYFELAYNNNEQIYESALISLEEKYDRAKSDYEQEYLKLLQQSTDNYTETFKSQQEQLEQLSRELQEYKEKKRSIMEAQLRERQILENEKFYKIQIAESDLRDIHLLESIKNSLTKPRVLCMIIWSSFYQKPMTKLCNDVVGAEVKTGIYKITNSITQECYIGQSLDISKRFKEHAKCGLGIDTPIGNKLYKAMQEYGLKNFTWEVLEECSAAQLNEREKYFIDFYDSKNYGYNTTRGNN